MFSSIIGRAPRTPTLPIIGLRTNGLKTQMNSRLLFRGLIFGLLILFISSCSEAVEEMDSWETQLSKELQATDIQFAHVSKATKVNGIYTESEAYLQLDIVNSKIIDKIDHNKRLLAEQCDEIRDKVLASAETQAFPPYNELRINLIEKRGVLIFKTEKMSTVKYRIH